MRNSLSQGVPADAQGGMPDVPPTDDAARVRDVFEKALLAAPDARHEFVERELSCEPRLRDAVLRMLDQDGRALRPLVSFTTDGDLDVEGPRHAMINPLLSEGTEVTTPVGPGRVRKLLSAPGRTSNEVYEVEQDHPARRIAVKVLRHAGSDSESLRRFRAEGRMLAMLDHEGIVPLLGVGRISADDGVMHPAIVTPMLDARRLDDWATSGRRTVRELAEMIARIASAVHYANLRGIVHRDLKPSNVLVDREDRPRVLDLGVARFISSSPLPEDATLATQGRMIVGTPAYMAPEQLALDDRDVDLQCDVYALGTMLWELLSERRAFDGLGSDLRRLRDEKLGEPPPLPPFTGVAKQVGVAARLAMHPNKAVRYQSCEEFATDIRRALAGMPLLRRPPGRAQRFALWCQREPTLAILIALTTVAVVTGGALVQWQATRARAQRDRATEMFEQTRRFADWVVFELDESLSRVPRTSQLRRTLIGHAADTLDRLRIDHSSSDSLVLEVAEARVRLARVLMKQLGERSLARDQLAEGLRVLALLRNPGSPVARFLTVRSRLLMYYASGPPDPHEAELCALGEELEELSAVLADDPSVLHARSELLWRLGRVSHRAGDEETMLERTTEALSLARASLELAPGDIESIASVADAAHWLAHAHLDMGSDALLESVAEGVRSAEALRETGDPRGGYSLAEALMIQARGDSARGMHAQAIEAAERSVALADESAELDPENKIPFRLSEVNRVFAATIYLRALRGGYRVAMPGRPLHLIREARDRLHERESRGWSTPNEAGYDENYGRLERSVRSLLQEAGD